MSEPTTSGSRPAGAGGGDSRTAVLVLGGLTLLVSAALGGYAWLHAGQESTDNAQIEADVVAVTSRIPGVIATVEVHDSQVLTKGTVLLTLDDADIRARLEQAKAERETARAQAAGARAQAQVVEATARGGLLGAEAQVAATAAAVQSAEAQIGAAQAAVSRAEAELAKATRDLSRATELVAVDAIATQQLDGAQLAHEAADAQVRSARAHLTAATEARQTAQSRVVEARARVAQTRPVSQQIAAAQSATALAEARLAATEAAVRLAELQLSYTKVVAPADGVVTQIGARPGGLVQMGQPLAQVVPTATYLVANFKETQIDRIRTGDRADVRIDAYPGRRFEARVESLSGGTGARFSMLPPDNATGNFVKVVQRVPVRLAWTARPDVELRAGLSAAVTVSVSGK